MYPKLRLNLLVILLSWVVLSLELASASSTSNSCSSLRSPDAVRLTAIGVEDSSKWVALGWTGSSSDEIVSEGEIVCGRLRIVKVAKNGVLVESLDSQKQAWVFLSGQAVGRVVPTRFQQFTKAIDGAVIDTVAPNVSRIRYPHYSDNNGLPETVYTIDREQNLWEDSRALGLGIGSELAYRGSQVIGIRLGANELNSVIGGIGFIKGEVISAINGKTVTSPNDVGRLLREAGTGRPISIIYTDGIKNDAFMTTYLMLSKRK